MRQRLARRFGDDVEEWFDALPPVLSELADRWALRLESLVQRGSISVVIRCRTSDGRAGVLKVSPEARRVVDEATALGRWSTPHVPAVLAFDETVGALLIEAIEPGTALDESNADPGLERVAALVNALHANVDLHTAYETVAERIEYLYDAGRRNYDRRPELTKTIPTALYDRGRTVALRLAETAAARVMLHGDLTPANVLDGGEARGLVAIDPAPCLGDPAFDAIDLVLWRTADVATVAARAERLGRLIDAEPVRLLAWCSAFAAMVALEIAEASDTTDARVAPLLALATSA